MSSGRWMASKNRFNNIQECSFNIIILGPQISKHTHVGGWGNIVTAACHQSTRMRMRFHLSMHITWTFSQPPNSSNGKSSSLLCRLCPALLPGCPPPHLIPSRKSQIILLRVSPTHINGTHYISIQHSESRVRAVPKETFNWYFIYPPPPHPHKTCVVGGW